jgi:hypothetical protein
LNIQPQQTFFCSFKKWLMITNDFSNTIAVWENALQQYSFEDLCKKPAAAWSLGQVYMHLLIASRYFIQQAMLCAAGNENELEQPHPAAVKMFAANTLPDTDITGPPSNNTTPQPCSKEQIVTELQQQKSLMQHAAAVAATSNSTGKTKHPGLHYFTAQQWLQFTEMHMRHHLRQKNKLHYFLKTCNGKPSSNN